MPELFELIKSNFALLLSTAVSVVAVSATFYQTHAARKNQVMSLYFSAQLDAYQKLYAAIGKLESERSDENVGALVAAAESAMLVSTDRNADFISHFSAVFLDYTKDRESDSLSQERIDEFVEAKNALAAVLRRELFRYDTMYHRSTDTFYKRGHRQDGHQHIQRTLQHTL